MDVSQDGSSQPFPLQCWGIPAPAAQAVRNLLLCSPNLCDLQHSQEMRNLAAELQIQTTQILSYQQSWLT